MKPVGPQVQILHVHHLAVEAAVTRHLASEPSRFDERQREALLRLVSIQSSKPSAVDAIRAAFAGGPAEGTTGVTAVWIDARFVSPIIALSAHALARRVFRADPPQARPIVRRDAENSVFGLRLDGFEGSGPLSRDHTVKLVLSVARATFRALTDSSFVFEALADCEELIAAA